MATSWIAATLPSIDHLLYSVCKLHLNINQKSITNKKSITKKDDTGNMIKQYSLTIIPIIEAIDPTFQGIRVNDRSFGGIINSFTCNWRQILSVIRRGSWADIVNTFLCHSKLWEQVTKLTINIQVQLSGCIEQLNSKTGNGKIS